MNYTGQRKVSTVLGGLCTSVVETTLGDGAESAADGTVAMRNRGHERKIETDPTGAFAHSSRALTAPLASPSREAPPIMAHEQPSATPPEVTIQRMSRAEGCPACVQNVEAPRAVIAQESGFTAAYHCETCGNYWLTNWSDVRAEWVI